ncbi:MAG: NAD(P)H-binding protein [Streptosporangiaceae bacterium]
MRVFVAGGTGVLGRRLVPQLVARGHQVTATTTSTAKLGLLERLGAEAVVMDGLDAVSAGGTVMRYGALYGPGATDDQVELVRKRQFPLVGRATGYASWVHLDDAASATVLAVEQQARGCSTSSMTTPPRPVSGCLIWRSARGRSGRCGFPSGWPGCWPGRWRW